MTDGVRRAVFLDRDGVINHAPVRNGRPYAPVSLDVFEILPGVAEALLLLRDSGFLNIVVTNQPDVANGAVSRAVVDAMHQRLRRELALDDIKTCFHHDAAQCACRKPKPGMLREAAEQFGIDLSRSFMVGDRWRDVAAGQAMGCTSLFVDHGYLEQRPLLPYVVVTSLAEAARWIVAESAPGTTG